MRFLDRLQPLALLALRLVAGIIMIAHGSMKVFGGMAKHVGFVQHLGVPGWTAYLSAGAEFGGGILLVAGLLTRLGGLAIFLDLLVAIVKVHWKNGLKGPTGYEFPLAVAVIAFALIFFGAGPISLDWVFFRGGGGTSRK